MKIISFTENEVEAIKNHLKENDTLHTVRISSEYGKYKNGEFVKTPWGERFVVIDLIHVKGMEHLKKECSHYEELKKTDFEKIEKISNYKKIEILKLKKVDNKKVY
ncbi:MAG: hypothetical protein ABIH28_02635 [archaeon]